MRMPWKAVIKSVMPPLLLQGVQRLRYGPPPPPEWEFVPEGWVGFQARGWNDASIAGAQCRKWPKFRELIKSPSPLAVSHEDPEPDNGNGVSHNAIMSYAYVLALAAQGRKTLSILDWGSGVGHYYPLSQELLPGVELDYHAHDLPHLCAAGRELNPQANFHEDANACWNRSYDLVLASASLQYSVEWKAVLEKLAAVTGRFLFVTRLPVVLQVPSFVVVQRVQSYGYDTEYCGWVFNRQEFLECCDQQPLIFQREFLMMDSPQVHEAPESVQFRGFLFSKPT